MAIEGRIVRRTVDEDGTLNFTVAFFDSAEPTKKIGGERFKGIIDDGTTGDTELTNLVKSKITELENAPEPEVIVPIVPKSNININDVITK